jgi:hypothetical protein
VIFVRAGPAPWSDLLLKPQHTGEGERPKIFACGYYSHVVTSIDLTERPLSMSATENWPQLETDLLLDAELGRKSPRNTFIDLFTFSNILLKFLAGHAHGKTYGQYVLLFFPWIQNLLKATERPSCIYIIEMLNYWNIYMQASVASRHTAFHHGEELMHHACCACDAVHGNNTALSSTSYPSEFLAAPMCVSATGKHFLFSRIIKSKQFGLCMTADSTFFCDMDVP